MFWKWSSGLTQTNDKAPVPLWKDLSEKVNLSPSVAETSAFSGRSLTGAFAVKGYVAVFAASFMAAGCGDLFQNVWHLLVL